MILLGLILLACAATYFGLVGAAFSSLMRLSLRLLAERSARTGRLGRYLDDPVQLFLPVRGMLGMVDVLAALSFVELAGVNGPGGVVLVLVAVAAFVLVFEHLVPLLIVRRDPERVLDHLLPSFDVVVRILWPVLSLVATVRRERPEPGSGEAQLEKQGEATDAYLDAGEQEGLIERDERQLLQSVVDFSDTLVHEVMTPRPDIVAIQAEATLDDLRKVLREQGYSRIPVYADSLDNILGIVFVKDVMRLPPGEPGATPVTSLRTEQATPLVRAAHVVPETKKVSELLREFQRGRIQIAIVVDEYGGTAGLVTIEDLLEELVGEIRDEDDDEADPVTEEVDGSFVITGKADIDAVAEHLGLQIVPQGFGTFGGYILARLGRVPATGEILDIDDLAVEVLDAERRRVHKVRVRRREVQAADGVAADAPADREAEPT